jgi:hypothetical protein
LREKLIMIPLILVIFWIGLYPKGFLVKMEPSVKSLIENAYVKYEENKSFEESFRVESQQMKQMEAVGSQQSSVISCQLPIVRNE